MKRRENSLAAWLILLCSSVLTNSTRAGGINDDYRWTAFPYYSFSNNITAYAQLGYERNNNGHTQTYNLLSPGLSYKVNPWLELWGGLNDRYNRNNNQANTFLFRPFLGPKLSIPNKWKWNLFNFTQYEYRATGNLETHDWSYDQRIRSRFEADAPLTHTDFAWKPRTFYSIVSVEPFYDIEQGDVIQLRVGGGIGCVLSKYTQLEFIYYAQFGRSNNGPLEYNENIFRLNLKIGLSRKSDAQEAATIRSQ
jgi:hypothetical protein